MNSELLKKIEAGAQACREYGFSFIEIYQTKNDNFINDGWDKYIISPVHVSEKEYRFLGFVREDGSYEIKK